MLLRSPLFLFLFLLLPDSIIQSLKCEMCSEYIINNYIRYTADVQDGIGAILPRCSAPGTEVCTESEDISCVHYVIETVYMKNRFVFREKYVVKGCSNIACAPIAAQTKSEVESHNSTAVESTTCDTLAHCQTDYCNHGNAGRPHVVVVVVTLILGVVLGTG